MSDYLRRVFRSFSRLFSRNTEQREVRARTPPKYFTPLRPPSRAAPRVPRTPRHSSTPAAARSASATSCPTIVRCPSQLSLKRFNSDSDLSLRSGGSAGNFRVRPRPIDRHLVGENDNTIPMRINESDISQHPSHKSSNSSFDYFSTAGDAFDPTESCRKMFPARRQFSKNKHILHPGCLHACENPMSNSKIPVRNLSRGRHGGHHNLLSQHGRNVSDIDPSQMAGGDFSFTSSDIGNWAEFRNDTTARFERVFKCLSRKKFPIGNLMDSASHARWMQMSGIGVERDAKIFKLFAGGKVVLNIGEYKFLLEKICKTYDLDYWDVMRRMAMTYQYEDTQQ